MPNWEKQIPNRTYTDEDILNALREVSTRINTKLTVERYREHKQNDHPSYQSIKERFGSWDTAKQKANIGDKTNGHVEEADSKEPDSTTEPKEADQAEEQVEQDTEESEVEQDEPEEDEIEKEEAEDEQEDQDSEETEHDHTREDCLRAVRNVHETVGGATITAQEYVQNRSTEHPDIDVLSSLFQNWDEILSESGIAQQITRQECIDAIREVADKIGTGPSKNEYDQHRKDTYPPAEIIENEYGYWSDALQDADVQ